MFEALREHYSTHLARIEELMLSEVDQWSWHSVEPMKERVASYLSRPGKRLRPLLALVTNALFSGSAESVFPAAAAIEIYHTATLIYDDIQDNSEFRRGLPCAHITASTSMAMNQAGVIRSLMYHVIHRSPALTPVDKLEVHRRIDLAASQVSLGQCIDIGWHEGWYPTFEQYPYLDMITGKSAALFGCAAATGAVLGGAPAAAIDEIEGIALEIGRLFQMVDDFLDVFGDPVIMQRPLFNDLRDGKISYPVLVLLDNLSRDGRAHTITTVLSALSERSACTTDWQWMLDLMHAGGVERQAITEFRARANRIAERISSLDTSAPARLHFQAYLRGVVDQVLNHYDPTDNERLRPEEQGGKRQAG